MRGPAWLEVELPSAAPRIATATAQLSVASNMISAGVRSPSASRMRSRKPAYATASAARRRRRAPGRPRRPRRCRRRRSGRPLRTRSAPPRARGRSAARRAEARRRRPRRRPGGSRRRSRPAPTAPIEWCQSSRSAAKNTPPRAPEVPAAVELPRLRRSRSARTPRNGSVDAPPERGRRRSDVGEEDEDPVNAIANAPPSARSVARLTS